MNKSFILLLIVLYSNISTSQENLALENELKKAVASESLVGAVWSTVRDDIVSNGAIGLKNADTNEILDTEDKVLIGSVTKTLEVPPSVRSVLLRPNSHDSKNTLTP